MHLTRPRLRHFERYRLSYAATCFYTVAPEDFVYPPVSSKLPTRTIYATGLSRNPLIRDRSPTVSLRAQDVKQRVTAVAINRG